jgi:hypothetical protein
LSARAQERWFPIERTNFFVYARALLRSQVLQLYAYFNTLKNGDEPDALALASIVLSAATCGFVAASISFDQDVSPSRRKNLPRFYGYYPNEALRRSALFLCSVAHSMLLLLLKGGSIAMLMVARKTRVWFAYFVVDITIFLCIRIARQDLRTWVPVYGKTGVVISMVHRIGVKVVNDFVGIYQLRAPGEIGGLHWTLSMASRAAKFLAPPPPPSLANPAPRRSSPSRRPC